MALTITQVLEHYGGQIHVPESGWRSVNCPFHDDSHASASVNLEKNAFCCHACAAHGDAIGLIKMTEHLDYGAACDWARSVFGEGGSHVSHSISGDRARKKRRGSNWRKLFD